MAVCPQKKLSVLHELARKLVAKRSFFGKQGFSPLSDLVGFDMSCTCDSLCWIPVDDFASILFKTRVSVHFKGHRCVTGVLCDWIMCAKTLDEGL